jgi:hypothetical protein
VAARGPCSRITSACFSISLIRLSRFITGSCSTSVSHRAPASTASLVDVAYWPITCRHISSVA